MMAGNGDSLNSVNKPKKSLEFETDSVSVNLIDEARSGIYAIDILQLEREPYKCFGEDNISALLRLGHFDYFHGKYEKALEKFFKALDECKTRKVSVGGMPFREIAKCYFASGNYLEAYVYGSKACEEDKKLAKSENLLEKKEGEYELCEDYLTLYKVLLSQGKEKEAEKIMKKAIELAKETNRKEILMALYYSSSEFYKNKNQKLSEKYKDIADSLNEKLKKENEEKLKQMFGE